MRNQSKKQKNIDSELSKIYSEMDKREDKHCTGCSGTSGLQHSHLIPRSRRRDLVAVKENITFHCLQCHQIWEHGSLQDMKTLYDFVKNMEYIKSVDGEYYKILTNKR